MWSLFIYATGIYEIHHGIYARCAHLHDSDCNSASAAGANPHVRVTHRLSPIPASTVGVSTLGPGSRLVNATCFLVPDDDARGNHSNTRFILVPAAGPYVQQRECARALYYLAPGVLVVGDTSEAREGGKPQVSARSGAGRDECSVVLRVL